MSMMLKKIQGAQDHLRTWYMCFLVVYMVVREVMPLQILINHTVLSVAIFGVGLALIAWDLLTERDCLKGRVIDWLVAFLVIAVLSSLIHFRYGVASNIKCIVAMVLEYFVFFPMGFKKNAKKTLSCILDTLIVTVFVFVLISVLMYIFSIDFSIVSQFGSGDQGYDNTWGRLWGVFGDPNVTCYFSLTTVFASVFLMCKRKAVWAYVWYGINILVQMMFMMLSLSRSGLLLIFVIPVIAALYLFLSFIRSNKRRAFGSAVAMVLAGAVLYGGYFGLMYGMPYVKAAVLNSVGESGRLAVENAYEDVYTFLGVELIGLPEKPDVEVKPDVPSDSDKVEVEKIDRKDDKEDYSNGRFARWKGGIEVFKTTPIFGTSPRNAVAIAKERTPNTVMGKYGWDTHCSYLEVLVNTGILGAVVMLGCLLYIAVKFLIATVKNGFDSHVFIAFLSFVTIAAGAFFVSDVFFVFSINALLFFYLLGYLYRHTADEKGYLAKLFELLVKGKRHETDSDLRP